MACFVEQQFVNTNCGYLQSGPAFFLYVCTFLVNQLAAV